MDTILASIRRILNEDEVSPAEERHDADDREHGGRDKDDVLVLGESMMVPPDKPEPAPTPVPAVPPIPDPAASPARASSSDRAAIESLVAARTPVAQPSASHAPTLLRAGGPTLEDLVRDELRGLLSNWLDVHLPGLVETLVRSEIEKLTRRGG
jgi:uncharacterized protein